MSWPLSVRLLREFYVGEIDSSVTPPGKVVSLWGAYEAGMLLINTSSNLNALQVAISAAAAQGQSIFTVNLPIIVPGDPVAIHLNGDYQKVYYQGIKTALLQQAIWEHEYYITIRIGSPISININFTFDQLHSCSESC